MNKYLLFLFGLIQFYCCGVSFSATADGYNPALCPSQNEFKSLMVDKTGLVYYKEGTENNLISRLNGFYSCDTYSKKGSSFEVSHNYTSTSGCYKFYQASDAGITYGKDFTGYFETTDGCVLGSNSNLEQNTVKKCIYYKTGFDSQESSASSPNWTLVTSGLNVSGIGLCSNSGTQIKMDKTGNYCWCRILEPFVSDWFLGAQGFVNIGSVGNQFCHAYCSSNCAEACIGVVKYGVNNPQFPGQGPCHTQLKSAQDYLSGVNPVLY